MRFYLITFSHQEQVSNRGITSAQHSVEAVSDMARQGWRVDRIQRGTEVIDQATLKADAEHEKAHPR